MNSAQLAETSKNLIPGGVNSPVRAFNAVGGNPMFFDKAKGPYIYNVEGEEILDFEYNDRWYPITDGHGFSLVVVDELAEPDMWDRKEQWKAGGILHEKNFQGSVDRREPQANPDSYCCNN